ncbi:haloacid dehalogenase-like hydrolase [Aliifodinibius sp. S!AR15-10]|uniref:HAD family hydrolase n=1 Tax=Aliifodinibius sp. S!AR15-10 TaxID=2950437 RepID=UPI0028626CBE|nr:HAD family hydrolase [Aliifodinibius sp. S!AR15-10]MDR8393487.1 haloacid dehalogenase-like hydrolase [Aliifodinibius sp. S!AR15-10]
MVDRFQKKEVAVFDLDGTLLINNSYKVFLFTWFIFLILNRRIRTVHQLFLILRKRLIKNSNRVATKRKVLELYFKDRNDLYEKYLTSILFFFRRKSVVKRLEELKGEYIIILATAAYCFYAKPLAKKFGISKIVCSTYGEMKKNKECNGLEKLKRIEANYGFTKFKYLFTDHIDDLPIAKKTNHVFLVNPAVDSRKKMISYFKSTSKRFDIL